MANIILTDGLRAEYERLFESCSVRQERQALVESLVNQLEIHRDRYQSVGDSLGIPWAFIAVIHNMEASQSFYGHLHNGDPLTARTRQVPAGRPKSGSPPFTWEQSAADALTMKGLSSTTDWSLAGLLYQLERYNGWGYRTYHPHVLSPYLWSFTNHYSSGKYVADGRWSESAVSKQCGAVALLRRMAERGLTAFVDQSAPDSGAPMVARYATAKPSDPGLLDRAMTLQAWLNTHPGIFLKVDGVAGLKTSTAYRLVTGHYLPGDPRG
ncbi:MAG: hypothetical protein GC145_07660 [Caulobacter sp.]|nr:hypothetical protein [Caulobacter sp.]